MKAEQALILANLKQNRCYSCNNICDQSQNLLINSDNLTALRALQKHFRGQVKCVYLDPPYNTGRVFDYGSDFKASEVWLDFMKQRLKLIHKLMVNDGFLFLQIDNKELHYIKILLDKIFGRENYRNSILISKDKKKRFDNRVTHLEETYHTILVYSKNPSAILPQSDRNDNWMDLFANGHKTDFVHELNEEVITRVLNWITVPGDLVMDAFAGSGTTCAVAEKMDRRWIGIEQGEHCKTICYPRLKAIVTEHNGIGFDFYEM